MCNLCINKFNAWQPLREFWVFFKSWLKWYRQMLLLYQRQWNFVFGKIRSASGFCLVQPITFWWNFRESRFLSPVFRAAGLDDYQGGSAEDHLRIHPVFCLLQRKIKGLLTWKLMGVWFSQILNSQPWGSLPQLSASRDIPWSLFPSLNIINSFILCVSWQNWCPNTVPTTSHRK